jgi:hypothetical protein
MIEWSETDALIREALREFVDKEIRPHVEALEHGETPPYELIRKFFKAFGIDAMARESFDPGSPASPAAAAAGRRFRCSRCRSCPGCAWAW